MVLNHEPSADAAMRAQKERLMHAQVSFAFGHDRQREREHAEGVLAFAISVALTCLAWQMPYWMPDGNGVVIRQVVFAMACTLGWAGMVKRIQTLELSVSSPVSLAFDATMAMWSLGYAFWLFLKVMMR